MEITKITKEEAIKDLTIAIKEEEYIGKCGMPQELATLLYAAYRKGVKEYQSQYWEADRNLNELKTNYTNLALAIADKIAIDRANDKEKLNILPF